MPWPELGLPDLFLDLPTVFLSDLGVVIQPFLGLFLLISKIAIQEAIKSLARVRN